MLMLSSGTVYTAFGNGLLIVSVVFATSVVLMNSSRNYLVRFVFEFDSCVMEHFYKTRMG